jgi:hypothetical protein
MASKRQTTIATSLRQMRRLRLQGILRRGQPSVNISLQPMFHGLRPPHAAELKRST